MKPATTEMFRIHGTLAHLPIDNYNTELHLPLNFIKTKTPGTPGHLSWCWPYMLRCAIVPACQPLPADDVPLQALHTVFC